MALVFPVITESDPGAVGASRGWFKRTTGELKIRNAADTGWDLATDPTKAPLASPTFTGNPVAPTPSAADNDTSIATTAFVQTEFANNPRVPFRTETGATYTIALTDKVIIGSGATSKTWTLPTAASAVSSGKSKVFTLKRKVGSAAVTADGDGSETIDGSATRALADGESIDLVSDGTEWYIT